ncbi:MAG: GNAT family N-acetyltransferase, partial [Jatrophihabitans sp.]|uniref:GNAT family N-acetyltransferase n=1 Tax=Jatrophihabitans sp. TaxID=1932789 RepID=UPI003F7D752B
MAIIDGVDLTDLVLTGPRLTLRPWRPDDADVVFAALRDDAAAARFTTVPVPYTEADAVAFTGRFGNAGRADGSELGGALVERATGRVVGSASLRLPSGDLGYIVYPVHRGQGYAAEAVRMLVAWAFAHGLHRVEIDADVRNLASLRTALDAGFGFEGVAWRRPVQGPAGSDRTLDLAWFARFADDDGAPIAPRLPWPTAPLDDGVLALRPLAPDDVDGLLGTEDAESVRWNFTGDAPRRADLARTCARAGLDWLTTGLARWAMVDTATGGFAGALTVRPVGPPQVAGIGYGVHPDFRGRGYTARALRLVSAWAFEVAGMARLELGAKEGNVASQRAALAGGFEPDGVRRSRLRNADGTFADEVRFALVNPDLAGHGGGTAPCPGPGRYGGGPGPLPTRPGGGGFVSLPFAGWCGGGAGPPLFVPRAGPRGGPPAVPGEVGVD